MRQELMNQIAKLEYVVNLLKNEFVSKDEIIELMATCAIAQEHILIVGPPGTAKSELVKRFSLLCAPAESENSEGNIPYFEYLLTRFTEPNEIFGPIDIKGFRKGEGHRRMTAGMLPKAEIAFLDEVFKANSAILNSLLTVLNERNFYNGKSREPVPLLLVIGATNEIPDDTTLAALFDRFLVRMWTDNVEEAKFGELFTRGWSLERTRIRQGYTLELDNIITTDSLRMLYGALNEIDMDKIANSYREVVRRIRAEGIELSDRRVIKLLKLIAASALRRRRNEATPSDFWVLKHVWSSPEQIPHLENIIEPYLDQYEESFFSAERNLETIDGDLNLLVSRQKKIKTDADYADVLHESRRRREELYRHSNEEGKKSMLSRVETLIDQTMRLLENSF